MAGRLPLGASDARSLGLIDAESGPDATTFRLLVDSHADGLAEGAPFAHALADKCMRRSTDERARALADYRAEELERMRMNFYGFDPIYHIARHRFVHRTAHAWTTLHLAQHRRLGFAARRQATGG